MQDTTLIDPALDLARARVQRSIKHLNAGDPDPMLEGYIDDVRVTTPLFMIDDPVQDSVIRGKAAFRDYLLTFLDHYGGFTPTDLSVSPGHMLVSLTTFTGDRKTLSIDLDEQGRGRRVTIFSVD